MAPAAEYEAWERVFNEIADRIEQALRALSNADRNDEMAEVLDPDSEANPR